MSARLRDKVTIVTGGASGMGECAVRQFAAEGAQVLLTDLNVEAGRRLAHELGDAVSFMQQDVSDPDGWQALSALVDDRYGRLDVLVNNAGILKAGTIEQTTLADWQTLMRVNADSVFLGCQMAVVLMKRSGGGSIINLSSIAAIAGKPDYLAYSASKGAIGALTRSVAAFGRAHRIRCNSLHPDGVLTPMTRAIYPQGIDPERLTIDTDPMNRACRPEDVAHAMVFLASDESRAINGIELRIDSGQFVMSI